MIVIGTLYAIATGLLWGGVGIVFSKVAQKKADFVTFMTGSSLLMSLSAWCFIARHPLISHHLPRLSALIYVLITAGMIGACGMITLNWAMRIGHHGATWTIGQSALVIPFTTGVLIWHDKATIIHIFGIIAAISGIFFMGKAQREKGSTKSSLLSSWFVLALISFILLGCQQMLTTIPSRWQLWMDTARLRIPLGLTGGTIAYIITSIILRRLKRKWLWQYSVTLACIILPSQMLLFKALDIMGEVSRAAIVYPIAVGTCILSFSLYSIVILRESISPMRCAGMGLGAIGVILTALG